MILKLAKGWWIKPLPAKIISKAVTPLWRRDPLNLKESNWFSALFSIPCRRVIPCAIVFFVDPDSLSPVSVLERTTEQDDFTEFRPTTVGKHLEEKMAGGHNLGK